MSKLLLNFICNISLWLYSKLPVLSLLNTISAPGVLDPLCIHSLMKQFLLIISLYIYNSHKKTGVGCHFLLQGIFQNQGSNLAVVHGRQVLYCLTEKGSPLSICAKSLQSCLTLCNPMDYILSGSSLHGILQARILMWVATLFSISHYKCTKLILFFWRIFTSASYKVSILNSVNYNPFLILKDLLKKISLNISNSLN